MAEATVTFTVGPESVTSVLPVDLPSGGETTISGDFVGTIPAGSTARIVGNVNLTGDLVVEGLLTGIDTFTLECNGFQILAQLGGVLDLAGVQKSGWVRWGDPVVGWQVGDRLAVAPTKVGIYTPSETTWQGTWAATTRPANSLAATLFTGQVMQPEVANLSQTIVLKNLRRVHFHDGAGVQTLKWLKVLNSGQTSILAQYPIHFHLNGETTRGSLLDGVVVEGGKNHSFVPHASHGITMTDCVAYKGIEDAFWWDIPEEFFPPPGTACVNCEPGPLGAICSRCKRANNTGGREHHVANNTNDTVWDHCLVLDLNSVEPFNPFPLGGFLLGTGNGNKCINSAAAAIRRGTGPSGFHWPSQANRNDGGNTWEFHDNVVHNNQFHGVFVWQNTPDEHLVEDLIVYRVGRIGIDHGSYVNRYVYKNIVVDGAGTFAMTLHPSSIQNDPMVFEDCLTNGLLTILGHQQAGDGTLTIYRRCTYTQIKVDDGSGNFQNPSYVVFEDCDLTPSDFVFPSVIAASVFELWEGGVLQDRWNQGAWT